MTIVRAVVGVAGLVLLGQGLRLVLDLDLDDLLDAGLWLAGGVVVHDVLLAPLVVLVGYVVARAFPVWARAPFAAAAVVLGTVTLAVLPVLGRFGAKVDDPYLLNRDYLAWWFVVAAVVVLVASVWAVLARRSAGRRTADA